MTVRPATMSLLLVPCLWFPIAQVESPPVENFVLEKGEHTIPELIRKSGEFLGRSYLLDEAQNPTICNPNDPGAKILIPKRVELDSAGCEEFIGQVLFARGWVAVPLDPERGLWDWVWLAGPKGQSIKQNVRHLPAEEIRGRPKLVDFVTTSCAMKHVNAQLVANNLRVAYNDPRGLMAIMAVGERSLTITAFRPAAAAILELLQRIDVAPDEPPQSLQGRLQQIERRLDALEKRPK